ncbi:hypothetical protein KBZ20_16340 [Vulcanococcus limneticus Candia 3F8]|uniref:hypothetical protein n=1 Tax=Vulcanococcus limneticus TaxID=2170428 RepID=UPI0020CC98F4|nr:hypothetical protein [Vulcanococcus limneticus]MCP9793334.1 hypothetical protein [Vulcanococcus limneticus MW73D5]MCP9895336.1 hypothetical protein [Vulcanococcus limneticus Candia 3F8]MCP9898732.1 hypothetical protein [Vulcanococcus limneticus Candia 3B3]
MAPTAEPEAEVIAQLVSLGAYIEGLDRRTGVMSHPDFDEWFQERGGAEYLALRLGRPLGLLQLHLLRRAARIRPEWLDPESVDLAEPLALQLLELAQTIAPG